MPTLGFLSFLVAVHKSNWTAAVLLGKMLFVSPNPPFYVRTIVGSPNFHQLQPTDAVTLAFAPRASVPQTWFAFQRWYALF